ncbi:unnamed protein product [Cyclocybe aegerita]|uniref:FMN hydroxy acid dehydrogenase domain-containing protein n=1 Tax=Cyclocybe aegerita TaxID=1973307 RepID=A0A8S0WR85_CYCAE|nr:unnamed protein product [Cyclocybe aegerita]
MRFSTVFLSFLSVALAARPFLNEPDTGIEEVFGSLPAGTLPELSLIAGLPDFEWAAKRVLHPFSYMHFRNGASGEYSYRNNLEIFHRYRFRPRVMQDVTNVASTLPITLLGHNFSAPIFISPCARAGLAHPESELGLVRGAAAENILYMPSLFANLSIEDISAAKGEGQVLFQQINKASIDNDTQALFQRIESSGAKAIVFTVDAVSPRNRQRSGRFGFDQGDYSSYDLATWDTYKQLQTMTSLPIVLKGIMSVEDARAAVAAGVPAIILSNHGGRQLDGAPSPLEVALEIHEKSPEVFTQIEVYADGGVRYGTDVLRLLALGVRAVGLGRPFMYANVYGTEGVTYAIQMLKREIAVDAGNLGLPDLKAINASYVNWTPDLRL